MPSESADVSLKCLDDIARNGANILKYTRGLDLQAFSDPANQIVRDAVERCVERMSEASRKVPDELKQAHPEFDWQGLRSIGNVFRHEYFAVSPERTWALVTDGHVAQAVRVAVTIMSELDPALFSRHAASSSDDQDRGLR